MSLGLQSHKDDDLGLGEADMLFVYIMRKAADLSTASEFAKVIGSGVLLGAAELVERLAAQRGGAPRLAAAGAIGALVSLLERLTHPMILTRIAGAIRHLAAHSVTRGLLVGEANAANAANANAGGGGSATNVLPALMVLVRECEHAAVLEQVGWALSHLAQLPAARTCLLEQRGAAAVLRICRGEMASREPAVLEAATAALASMCAHRPTRALVVADEGGEGLRAVVRLCATNDHWRFGELALTDAVQCSATRILSLLTLRRRPLPHARARMRRGGAAAAAAARGG